MSHAWGYGADTGPDKWADSFPIANGPRQSPIDIVPGKASYDPALKPLVLKYDPSTCLEILNNGHSFQVTFLDDIDSSTLKDGPVLFNHRLKQFHFHWGLQTTTGLNTLWPGPNTQLNSIWCTGTLNMQTLGEAASQPDGLAVVGVFLKIGKENPNLQKLIDAFDSIKTKGSQCPFADFNPETLLPGCLDYWTYEGSLTTPPLLESVTWIVCKEPISVSSEQMAKFRSLLFSCEGEPKCCMVDNYRPPQPLKGRTVRASFK